MDRIMRGQSLFEVILALAIFSLMATTLVSMSLGGTAGLIGGGEFSQADSIASEGVEAVRAIRVGAWNELPLTPTPIEVQVNVVAGQWILNVTSIPEIIGKFSRLITIENVCRSSTGDHTACPGFATDLHSKKVTSHVEWQNQLGITNIAEKVSYLTNWDSSDWVQNDWSGGNGQSVWSDETKYNLDDNNIDASDSVRLRLENLIGDGVWALSGGIDSIDTTDADFDLGAFDDTQRLLVGSDAYITLTQDLVWAVNSSSDGLTNRLLTDVSIVSFDDVWAVGAKGTIMHYSSPLPSQDPSWKIVTSQVVGTEDIFGVSFSSPNTGYAAGSRGKVYYWNGIDWADFDTGNHAWKAIDTLAFEDVWMVGNGSNIAHFDGSFTFYTSPENSNLTSIHMLSPTSGFAAGNKGIILEWDGSSWEATDLGSQAFEDIYMISSTEGWVVADNGTIFHLKNGIWQDESLNSSVALNTVYMLDAFDGWVAGQNAVYRWDGSSWNFFQSDPQQWRSLEMLDNTDGWLIGSNGTIYRFSQNYNPVGKFESRIFDSGAQNIGWHYIRWLETLNSDSSLTLSTRTGASPSVDATWSAWSIEYINKESTELTSPFNRYLQYRATLNRGFYGSENPHLNEVTIVTTPPAPDNVYAIDMISDDDGWAVGHAGTIFYYNGLQWVLHPDSPGGNEHLYGIDMVSSTEGWIVGKNGAIFHFDGSNWMREIYSGLFSSDLRAVSIVPSGSDFFGFAVGIGGRVIKYENGSWTDLGRPSSTRSLYGVQVISETEAWAVGDSGTIGHWTGVWEPIIDTGSTGWRAISMTADGTNGWIVGAAGRMIERVGGFWVPLPDGERAVTTTLYGVSMLDPNYAWAVGARGKTALWDGNAWREIQNAASQSIRAVSVSSPFSTWAVGDKNLFMKLIREGSYAPSGYLISSAFDTGVSSNMQVIEWDENTNCVGCNVELQIQVSNDGSSWSQWEGPQGMDGDEDDFYSIPPGEILSTDFNGYRWIRYKAILSGDGTDTPALSEIRINYK